MKAKSIRLLVVFVIFALLIGTAPAGGHAETYRLEAGKVYTFQVDSPSPAPTYWKQIYTFTDATYLRLHFVNFDLAPGDMLIVSSPDGTQSWQYTSAGLQGNGEFWSYAVTGDQVAVEFIAPSGQSSFKISEVAYGTIALDSPLPIPEVVCGSDGREPIACHMDELAVASAQSPVARLLFVDGRNAYLCTGELVRGKYANTLITNEHCIDSQEVVSTLEARFNYQQITCEDTALASAVSYAGKKFLKTNDVTYKRHFPGTGLDYTLLTLRGNAEATFGELIPTTASLAVGDEIYFIQHPGGRPKEIGYWDDAEHSTRCSLATVAVRYVSTYPSSQIGYSCDSEGGSSGSAITRGTDGKMIGLHHYGGVEDCLNSATMMSLICADAGPLLICDGD
jgi:lysyl endopeptidase